MKKNSYLSKGLFALAMATAIFSCEKGADDNFQNFDEPYSISFEGELATKATDTAFESGDSISVTAYNTDGSVYESNVAYTYSNNVFTSNSAIRYIDEDHSLSFRAIYPYAELSTTNILNFKVLTAQNEGSDYTKSDLMKSYVSETTSTTPKLTFDHLLTKVIINITSEDIEMTDVSTSIEVATEVDYNVSTLSYTSKESLSTVKMASNGTNSFKAIIVPQNITAGVKFGEITVGSESFEITFENGKILKAGSEYEFDLSIRAGIVSFVSSSINDWDDGDDSSEGSNTFSLSEVSSSSYPASSKSWIITDSIATVDDFAGLRAALYNLRWSTSEKPMLSFPNLTSLPASALYDTEGFESISLPEATSIGEKALYSCGYLAVVEAPKAETVETSAFYANSAMTTVDLSSAVSIGTSAFSNCTALATLSLPAATTIESYAFNGCSGLTSLSLPAAITINTYAFNNCTSLKTLLLPVVTTVSTYAFSNCTSLTELTLATESELVVFGDSDYNCFSGVEVSNIALTIGENVSYCDKTLIVPITNNGTATYASFASITGGKAYEDVSPTYLSEYSATNYPLFSNEWVVNDTEQPLANFMGLNDALSAAAAAGRMINLSFPNLDRFPSTAFYINSTKISSILSVDAPKATYVGNAAFSSSSIETVSLPNVTEIGASAFYGCTGIKEISLPSIEIAGGAAFYTCTKLADVYMPKLDSMGSSVFYECTSLTSVSFPELKTMGTHSFYGCSKLAEASLPELTAIETLTFRGCSALTELSLPKVLTISGTTQEQYAAFYNCSALTKVSLDSAISIGSYSFYGCDALEEVYTPVVKILGSYAFYSCDALKNVSMPFVTTINFRAFGYCVALETITLTSATTINGNAFYGCKSLSEVSMPSVETIDYNAFYNCSSLKEVSAPKLTTMGDEVFYNCSSLTSIAMPLVETVGTYAFYNCDELTAASLPVVTSLGNYAFSGCAKLQSLSFPALSKLYAYTFSACYMLYNLEIASNDGVKLTYFGLNEYDLFNGIDLSYMYLTTGSANASMVSGNYFIAPAYSTTSSSYVDKKYGPFKEITVKTY